MKRSSCIIYTGNKKSREPYLPSVDNKDHISLPDESLTVNPASDFHGFQKNLLNRKMGTIPLQPFYSKICIKLDAQRPLWDDFRQFGAAIGLNRDQIYFLGQREQPTHCMLEKFDSQKNSSIEKFKNIMENMDRHDIVAIIDEWISYEWGKEKNQAPIETNKCSLPDESLTVNPASDFHGFQKNLLNRKMETIPLQRFYSKICTTLDEERPHGNDFRTFGETIGLSSDEIYFLRQRGQPTHCMLQKFDSQKNSSIEKFKNIMENMDRHDVVAIIDEWISYEWGKEKNQAPIKINKCSIF